VLGDVSCAASSGCSLADTTTCTATFKLIDCYMESNLLRSVELVEVSNTASSGCSLVNSTTCGYSIVGHAQEAVSAAALHSCRSDSQWCWGWTNKKWTWARSCRSD